MLWTVKSGFLWGVMLLWLAVSQAVAGDCSVAVCKEVCDGDTVKLYMRDEIVSVRLLGIDAPELGQDYGQESKAFLSRKILGKELRIEESGSDRYGRPLCVLYLDYEEVNLTMLKEGMAWSYFLYESDARYVQAEDEAKAAKLGLWQNPKAQRPAEFRKCEQDVNKTTSSQSKVDGQYWVSKTGVIHNCRCRYYKSCAGKAAINPQGRDCKKCGGRKR